MRTALLLLAAFATGCNTQYMPKGPRVSMVMSNGALAYTRDGVLVEPGFFGGGLVQVVEGDEAAVEIAESHEDLNGASFGLALGGLALAGAAGGTLIGSAVAEDGAPTIPASAAALAMSGTGLGLAIAGLALGLKAQTKLFDAINVFNNNVEEREKNQRMIPSAPPNPTVPSVAPTAPPGPLVPLAPGQVAPVPPQSTP
jgi:hypothetical protein